MADESETTRAANTIDNTDALKAGGESGGFGVFGCYTGLHKYLDSNVHPDFMYNEHVSWGVWQNGTDEWGYSPLKYWPNGEGETYASLITGENPHYVSFMAYAPYTSSTSSCIYRFSKQGDKGDPWLEYRLARDVSSQVDLLYALPLLDEKKHTVNERLLFTFNHALACVGDRITLGCCDEYTASLHEKTFETLTEVRLNSVTVEYTLTEEGRLVLWSDKAAPNWHLVNDGTPTTKRSKTWTLKPALSLYKYETESPPGTTAQWTDAGNGVFYIPKQYGNYLQTVKLTANFTVIFDEITFEHESSITIKLSDYPNGYQAGKHLYINVSICGENADEPVLEANLDDVQMAVGSWKTDEEEHPVYNW